MSSFIGRASTSGRIFSGLVYAVDSMGPSMTVLSTVSYCAPLRVAVSSHGRTCTCWLSTRTSSLGSVQFWKLSNDSFFHHHFLTRVTASRSVGSSFHMILNVSLSGQLHFVAVFPTFKFTSHVYRKLKNVRFTWIEESSRS